jgi:ATP-binding cassette subfamily B protein
MYKNTLYQPYEVSLNRNSSVVITGISSKAKALIGSTFMPIFTIISSGLMCLSIMIVLMYVDFKIAISAFLGFATIYFSIIILTKKKLAKFGLIQSKMQVEVVKSLQEGLGGIRDIIIDGTQDIYCNQYVLIEQKLRESQAKIQTIGVSPRYIIETLGMVLITLLAYRMNFSSNGILNVIPVIGTLALGAQRLLPILQLIYSSWITLKGNNASLIDALFLLSSPSVNQNNRIDQVGLIPFQKSITLSNLSFKFQSFDHKVIEGINLEIKKGERIGLIGTTGSGKSTLLDIIMGLLRPTDGKILIDSVELTNKNMRSWQSRIAHVPQSIFLSDTTIKENIAFGAQYSNIDISRVKKAAENAQISEIIEEWSDKYETKVGERGVRLSGGQRQRIGIARALYKNASVIIFDEATSALDSETEKEVMSSIQNLGNELTIFMVAHRISTLVNCDRIIEIKEGKISRIGSFNEICTNN